MIETRPVEFTVPSVPTAWGPRLQKKLDKLNRKLAKMGAAPATVAFGPTEDVTEVDEFTGFKRHYTVWSEVTVTGVEASWSGWSAVASLDHTLGSGEAFVTRFPGHFDDHVPAEFVTRGPVCDHCGIRIDRHLTVLFRHDDGDWKQVGTSCCVEFIGVDPSTVLWLVEARRDLFDEDDWFGGGSPTWEIAPAEFLAAAAAATHHLGFVPSKDWDREPTREVAWSLTKHRYTAKELAARFPDGVDTGHGRTTAAAVMEWVAADDSGSDFMSSAQVACRAAVVTDRTAGLLASLPHVYAKAMGRKVEQEAKKAAAAEAGHLGDVGDKVTVDGTVSYVAVYEPYAYGGAPRYRVTVVGDEGHRVTTFGSGKTLHLAEQGARVRFTGKVKEHETHDKYGESTVLTMAKVVPLDDDDEPLPTCSVSGCSTLATVTCHSCDKPVCPQDATPHGDESMPAVCWSCFEAERAA